MTGKLNILKTSLLKFLGCLITLMTDLITGSHKKSFIIYLFFTPINSFTSKILINKDLHYNRVKREKDHPSPEFLFLFPYKLFFQNLPSFLKHFFSPVNFFSFLRWIFLFRAKFLSTCFRLF